MLGGGANMYTLNVDVVIHVTCISVHFGVARRGLAKTITLM